jgi:hypothetical protein
MTEIIAAGFYKREEGSAVLLFAPNAVYMPDGTSLLVEQKTEYQYPINGWNWFDTKEQAYASHGLEIPAEPAPPAPPVKLSPADRPRRARDNNP